jgi:hypothetical protein
MIIIGTKSTGVEPKKVGTAVMKTIVFVEFSLDGIREDSHMSPENLCYELSA